MAIADLKAATRIPPKLVTIRVKRWSPTKGKVEWREYQVETYRGMTVLEALLKVKAEKDHTLSMRYSCRMGVCGSCGMVINGVPRLACQTQIAEVASESNPVITIEPLYNHPVIRDLATDFNPFFGKHASVKPYLIRKDIEEREGPTGEYILKPEELENIYQFSLCISCGLCYSACPVAASDPEYLGPQALAQALRFIIDPRDEDPNTRIAVVDSEHGCHRCHYAATCSAVCPKAVDPAMAIQMLRSIVFRHRLGFWRKRTSKPAEKPKEWQPKKPMPPEAQTIPGVDLEQMEKEPVIVEVDGIKVEIDYKFYKIR